MSNTPREEWLQNTFTYHPPTEQQVLAYQRIREAGKNLAEVILQETPDGPDNAKALDAVREAVMWANASIACSGVTDNWYHEKREPEHGVTRTCVVCRLDVYFETRLGAWAHMEPEKSLAAADHHSADPV